MADKKKKSKPGGPLGPVPVVVSGPVDEEPTEEELLADQERWMAAAREAFAELGE